MRTPLETANTIAQWANYALIASLATGVVATILIVWMANIKESYWDVDRLQSRERIASLDAAVAVANQRAAEANRLAEKERLARVEIESRLASRRLSPEQAARLIATLKPVQVKSLIQVTRLGDQEASVYADDIISALKSAGFHVVVSTIGVMAPPPYGLVISEPPGAVLAPSFASAGIDVQRVQATSATPQLLVGLKPPAF